ncbi:MAG: carboxypeptidase regulatory-like domain-containing protein, partial [Cellulomonadaceae bacterium]|nr:carboxypeptidase regulatory-like domain-containing protein [Cellulomonadaceae bacterium]
MTLMGSAEAKPAFDARCLSGARLNADLALDTVGLEPGFVSGVVTDMDGAPLEGVKVSVGSTIYDTTGVDGRYEIEGIVPGTYSLVCAHPDYLTRVVPGVVGNPGPFPAGFPSPRERR